MKNQPKTSIFVVGCPRSGTTLLQSLLAAHPQILSFPESKFFHYLVPLYEPRRRAWGLVSRQFKPRLNKFFQEDLGRSELLLGWPKLPLQQQYTRKFIQILDQLTQEQGKTIWVEKTPEHIYYVDDIVKLVPHSRFIHIIRNGADVIASLYQVTREHPRLWKGAWSLEFCIERWIQAIEISRRYLHQPRHCMVRYEQLVENPALELPKLCQFMGVDFQQRMLKDYQVAAQQVTLAVEPWKAAATKPIAKAKSEKFYQVFDATQREYILQRVSGVSLEEFQS
jgi:hypothetical protein